MVVGGLGTLVLLTYRVNYSRDVCHSICLAHLSFNMSFTSHVKDLLNDIHHVNVDISGDSHVM